MLLRHYKETIEAPPITAFPQPGRLLLDIRTNEQGHPVLHFPFMSISDIHWSSKFTRAKRVCMLLDNITSDRLDMVGDIVGGIELMKKNTFHIGPWHRQGIARVLQKAKQETQVNVLPGNHEPGMKEKIGAHSHIYGVNFVPESEYTDPKGRRFKIEHGDRFDEEVFKTPETQARWYAIGDTLLSGLYEVDNVMRQIPMLEKFSIAAGGKRAFKRLINERMGVYDAMNRDIDASAFDGLIYGHSHMKGYHRTPKGKLLLNDGCCTDHVQFAVHDAAGNWGIIEYHRDRMDVEMEDGQEYSVYWKDLGLQHFGADPVLLENEETQKADRLLRLAYRLWPSKDRQATRATRSRPSRTSWPSARKCSRRAKKYPMRWSGPSTAQRPNCMALRKSCCKTPSRTTGSIRGRTKLLWPMWLNIA